VRGHDEDACGRFAHRWGIAAAEVLTRLCSI
jgi:hypothetical protein